MSLKVLVDPFVALSILDHHQRRGPDEDQVRGALLGTKGKGVIKITNFIPSLADAALSDLTLRTCPQDSWMGWYATEPTLSSEVDRSPNTSLFLAVHLPTEEFPSVAFKAFQVEYVSVADQKVRTFREAPCEVAATSAPSAVAVDTIVRQLCPNEASASDPSAVSSITTDKPAFAEFQQLRRNLKQAQLYCAKASEGKIEGDATFGRKLSSTLLSDLNTLSLSPNLDRDIETTAQDSLMLSYIMKLLAQKVSELRMSYHETLEDLTNIDVDDDDDAEAEGGAAATTEGSNNTAAVAETN